jgi:hypothetical protein
LPALGEPRFHRKPHQFGKGNLAQAVSLKMAFGAGIA